MQSLPRSYDFKQLEQRALEKWKTQKLVEKTTEYNARKPIFSFLEGPPTANAPPALHHVEMRVFKDVVNRYQFMRGKSVPRKAGWDTHGLPVEVQVEKKLGLKNKREIEKYGTDKFVEECRKDVNTFIHEWDVLTERMAYWIDLEKPYVTMSNNYIESVWWSLSEMFKRGYLYEGHKTVPFCPRCQTSLSSHEVAQGYKVVKDTTATVKFIWKKNPKRAFLAWTTTPWTLPGNMALAVNKDVDYAVVEHEGMEYVLAHVLVNKHFPEEGAGKVKIKEVIPGSKLVNTEYFPPFDTYTKKQLTGKSFVVIAGDFVTVQDGTGIVHIAPGFGEDDYRAGKENNLAFVQHVGEDGLFKTEMGEWAGKNHKLVEKELIAFLQDKELVFKTEKYEHEYPHCWRCSTPLMYFATKSWFVNVSQHRDLLKKVNQTVRWTPDHVKEGRFGEWIANAKDWGISRKRYWGTPLNIWRCTNTECGNLHAAGSVADIRARGKNVPKGEFDLHKPTLDKIVFTCEKCSSDMKREPDVIDCWYDSGSAPFAQLHYPFENKDLFEKFFPYDFIAEGQDQTRGWFYTMMVINALLFGKSPYKTVICGGLLLDQNGEKMSKSKGNVIVPATIFDAQGVDAVRLWFATTSPGSEKKFGTNAIAEGVRPFLNVLWNSLLFAQPYLNTGKLVVSPTLETEDEWILSRLSTCRDEVTEGMETYEFNRCTQALFTFVNEDFSRTYIKLVRERAKQGDDAVAHVFYHTFNMLARLLAPLAPYVSETIFDTLNGEGASVHTSQWPEKMKSNPTLEQAMVHVQGIITAGLFLREKEKINVRWPLRTLNVQTPHNTIKEAVNALMPMIQNQLNVKQVHVNGKIFSLAHVLEDDPETIVSFDTTIDEELEAEGFARELTRKIQDLRKKGTLNPTQQIAVQIRSSEKIARILKPHVNDMANKVRAQSITFTSNFTAKQAHLSTETVRDETIEIGINTLA